MEGKYFYKSKTFWVNIVAVVASLFGVFGLDVDLNPEVQATIVTTIMGVVNIILRFTTKEPIKPMTNPE